MTYLLAVPGGLAAQQEDVPLYGFPIDTASEPPAEISGVTTEGEVSSEPSATQDGVTEEGEAVEEPVIQKPPNKPVVDMTPEERRIFRIWRHHQMMKREAEQAAKEAKNQAPPGAVTFELPFPEEKGSGSASGWAGSMRFQRDDLAVLADGVEVRYQDIQIRADLIEVDLTTKVVEAFGNVVLDQGPRRLAGATLSFDLEAKTGSITNASAYVDPDFYFAGTKITKTGENSYSVEDGVFTSCEGDSPAWSFTLGRADIEVDGYARVRHAAMKVKRAPVLYLPYMLWPVKPDRTSGFLVPNIGYSNRRGAYLGLAYYQVLGQSYDTTFFLDLYSKDYVGVGNEIRYQPTEGTKGEIQAYTLRDPVTDDWEWKLNLDHRTTDLPFGMRGVLKVEEYSDFDFFRDFERSVDRNTKRRLESRGFASGSWGPHSLNILVNNQETFFTGREDVTLQRLPEVEYLLRSIPIGNLPLRFEMDSSLNYLGVDRGELLDSTYARADLAPQLTLPLKVAPWLSVSLGAGYRWTYYGDSIGTNADSQQTFSGESVTRSFPFASAGVVGPAFSRIFEKKGGRYEKLKHVFEPRFTYSFLGDVDERDEIPLFDEIDRFGGANIGRVALINRILAKPRPKEGQEGGVGAREVLSWEISQRYSFDSDVELQRGDTDTGVEGSQASPISNLVRFNPSERTNMTARLDYNTAFSRLTSTSLSGSLGLGKSTLALSWRTSWNAVTGDKRSDQVRIGGGFNLLPASFAARRLKLTADVVYDIEKSMIQQQRFLIDYASKCYSYRLEWRETEFGDEREQDIRFSLTLKNVGTFLDLTN